MEFAFPPAPPGYADVLVARWLLVAWALLGVGILIFRFQRWKFIQWQEMIFWGFAGAASWFVAEIGTCHYYGFDNNDWLAPAVVAALSISVAGITIGLAKLYVGGSAAERWFSSGIVALGPVVIAGVLLPSLGHPREYSYLSQCKNNLKSIALSMHNYQDLHGHFPPPAYGDEPISWRVSLLPYFDQKGLVKQYDPQKPWDHVSNAKIALQKAENLICPSNYFAQQDSRARWFTAYSMPTGPHTIGERPTGTRFQDITDGSSNTLLIVEACGTQIVWTEPRDVDVARQPAGVNLSGKIQGESRGWLSSYHYRGAHVALADGRVQFLSANTDPALLKKLATIDGGEQLNRWP